MRSACVSIDVAPAPPTAEREFFWLDKLKEAHADLLAAIDELAQLTRGPVPDKDLLVSVR
jgi:hypothetical protein